MRASILAAVPLLLTIGTGYGADLAWRGPPPAPLAPAPVGTWTGFYIGLNGGGGITNTTSDFDVAGIPFATAKNSLTGALGGGQIGYNWQQGPALFGVEADFQFSGMQGTLSTACPVVACVVPVTASFTQKMPWFGTARGRLGLVGPSWLVYATGGYAYARIETDASASAPGIAAAVSQTETRNGWTVGGGIEVAVNRAWSAKVEYLYLDFGSANNAWTLTGLPTVNDNARIYSNVVRAGVNYKF
jgi:outer membrane immunogenic protein